MCVGVGQGVSLALERVSVRDALRFQDEDARGNETMSLIYPRDGLSAYPKHLTPAYKSTVKRSPTKPLILMPHTLSELTGPVYGHDAMRENDNDLTKQARRRAARRAHHRARPYARRGQAAGAGCAGRECGRPMPAAATCIIVDQHPAPLDPNFTGAGRTVTDKNGYYKFITVKPGAYPWGNHHNAWRPNHIHFSVFGHSFLSRLVTQMYFPGDYLFPFDPIFNSVHGSERSRAHGLDLRSRKHRARLGALLPLRHRAARPRSHSSGSGLIVMSVLTPSQTVGPFYAYGLTPKGRAKWDPNGHYSWKETIGDNLVTPDVVGDRIRIEGGIYDGDGKPIPDAMLEIWQADGNGRYSNEPGSRRLSNAAFKGHGRSACDKDGIFSFDTVKPGAGRRSRRQGAGAAYRGLHLRARHAAASLYRLYFDGEAANATDPVLNLVPADRRGTLIAKKEGAVWRWDVHMQGDKETVFFDV